MLNSAYDALRQFQNKFSENQTISEIQALFQDRNLELLLQISSTPADLSWDLCSDSFTGSWQMSILPKLYLCGELFECRPSHVSLPPSFGGLEGAFLAALKDSLGTAARVWD